MTLNGRALVVDDNVELCRAIADSLRAKGCVVETATDPSDGLAKLQTFEPDVLITDVRMPGLDGFSVLAHAQRHDPLLGVVVLTGFAAVKDAVRAMRSGAEHYMVKPVSQAELLAVVRRVLQRQRARIDMRLQHGLNAMAPHGLELIGTHDVTVALINEIAEIAKTDQPVFVHGERGTGKEGVARAIHAASMRAERRFVRVDCGAVTEALLDVELFGSEAQTRDGRVHAADCGTLFLDGAEQLTIATKTRLLRLMRQRSYERNGGRESLRADVRVIAASDASVAQLFESNGVPREPRSVDAVARVEIQPLRNRKSDVPLLVEYALARAATGLATQPVAIEPEAIQLLTRYEWPGNVRELQTVLDRLVTLAPSVPITAAALAPSLRRRAAPPTQDVAIPGASFQEIERQAILATYEGCGRNVLHTARILGISPRAVHYRLREYRGERGRRAQRVEATEPGEDTGSRTPPKSRG